MEAVDPYDALLAATPKVAPVTDAAPVSSAVPALGSAPPAPSVPQPRLAANDPYDTLLAATPNRDQMRLAQAQAITASNANVSPAKAGQAAQIGRQLGLPQAAVETDPEPFQAQATTQKNYQLLAQSPGLAAWVAANPEASRIARDDYEKMSGVEKLWDTTKNYAWASATQFAVPWNKLMQTAGLAGGALPSIYSYLTGDTGAADWYFKKFVEPAMTAGQSLALRPEASFGEKAVGTVSSLVSTMAQMILGGPAAEAVPASAAVAPALATAARNAVGQMAIPSLTSAVETGRQVYEATGDAQRATGAAVGMYMANTAQGMVPLNAAGNLMTRLTTGFVSGAVSGEAQRGVMNLLLPEEMRSKFNIDDAILSGITGSIMAGVMGPRADQTARADRNMNSAIRQTYVDALAAERAEKTVEMVGSIHDMTDGMELRKSDPEAFHQFIESVTDDSEVKAIYVNGRKAVEAFAQSGEEMPPEMKRDALEAVATGGDVRVTVADYAQHIAGTDIEKALMPEMKAEPDGPTYAEAQQHFKDQTKTMTERAKQIAQQHAEDQAWQESAQRVYDDALKQHTETNRFPAEVNKTNAAITRDMYTALAERLGVTPEEAYKQHPLFVSAEGQTGHEQSAVDVENQRAEMIDLRKRETTLQRLLGCVNA